MESKGGIAAARSGVSGVDELANGGPTESELAQAGSPRVTQLTVFLAIACSLLATATLLFLAFSRSRYRATYAAVDSGFLVGEARLVELTLVRADMRNLACASDVAIGSLRCGFDGSQRPVSALPEKERLRPYNTVRNELLLVAGLWSVLAAPEALPKARFTVVCEYHVTGVLKSAALRWEPAGRFAPLDRSVPVGFVTQCQIPP